MKKIIIAACVVLGCTSAWGAYPNQKISGTYKYSEKGWTGTMKIKVDNGAKYADFTIDTLSKDKKRGCTFEGGLGEEDNNGFPTYGQGDGATFSIRFKDGKAEIKTKEIGTACGMNGNGQFGGIWVKVK